MIPAEFDYVRARSVDEALALLAEADGDARALAGGQSLLPLMKLRLARPGRLVDIGRLAELRGVRDLEDGGLAIGALTTWTDLLEDARAVRYGAMADALPRIGDVQVRNRGTIGGSVAHADPAADIAAVLLALDAVVVARSAGRGERTIEIDAFFEGPFETALAGDELLVELRIPPPGHGAASAYQALAQPASGYPIAGVAAVVGAAGVDAVRLAVTGVGERPYRAAAADAALVADGIEVSGDIHADPEYRAAMAVVMAERALELARARRR